MTYEYVLIALATLTLYCLTNSIIMSGLCILVQPTASFSRLFIQILSKTILSLVIVFSFFFLMARMFCVTAWLAQCIQCICPTLTTETFVMQNTVAANIFLFLGMAISQAILIPIPQRLSPLVFITVVIASNLIASLLKLGIVAFLL